MELTMGQTFESIPSLIAQRVGSQGGQTILRYKNRGIWNSVSWEELDAQVREIGGGLIAAGVGHGDVAAVMSEMRREAVYADLAILGSGAAGLAVDPDMDVDQLAAVVARHSVKLMFVENEEQLDKVLAVRPRCPSLGRIVIIDMTGLRDFADAGCSPLAGFVAPAATWPVSVRADDAAVVNGGSLTHGELMRLLDDAKLGVKAGDERLAALRLSDPTERIWGLYLGLMTGCVGNLPEGPDTIMENLQELQPTVLGGSAVVWEYLCGLAAGKAKDATGTQRRAYEWALRSGGGLANVLVLDRVRSEFGLKRLRVAYSGGAPVSAGAMAWARALGIDIRTVGENQRAAKTNAYA